MQEISDCDDEYEDAMEEVYPDEVDISKLNCDDLIGWLSTQKIALNKIQESFKGLLLILCTYTSLYKCISCKNTFGVKKGAAK